MNVKVDQYVDLKPHNTMGISCFARYLTRVTSEQQLSEVLLWAKAENLPVCPLGEGSNVVFSGDYEGLVILVAITGCETTESNGRVLVKAGAGENWHGFVRWALDQGLYGIENLSLIPGCVGAAPIQNIGAYGVEIKDVFHSLQAMDVTTGEVISLDADACQFGYRDSVFKGELRDRYVITSVTLSLSKVFESCLGYGHLQKEVLQEAGDQPVTGQLVSDVICRIRNAKLPSPEHLGNAGSFFKNPVICDGHYKELLKTEPDIVLFPAGNGRWKLAAGWVIEHCGFKGVVRESGAGVYKHQALVLVNHGSADGQAILALAEEIQQAVRERFGVLLEREPRVY
ncbi:UDP-N-acetylmuramate dehydrogenase [Sansalvadorimonas verongulae]|uniref:UDP-N-acetylmuramate dehydrogenase n=1 Tax=Sansalvadorimonas verongulae TaxID=2172824 RepID=UPI002E31DFE0|nr:UDP-N-acetylmuramate dehydrogenase [Sansalvadorimonas verongulae]MTI14675.1 UDP-N-acetylmuramate dehydrogenase [Sansalvadorimonas verongulae]